MTVFTEYLAAVRAYEQEREASQGHRVSTPEKSAEDLAAEAEVLFNRLVHAQAKIVAPASVNSQLRGL